MKSRSPFLVLYIVGLPLVETFTLQVPKRRKSLQTFSSLQDTATATDVAVTTVSVCTAELCCYVANDEEDGTGIGGNEIFQNLCSRKNLPYDVHEIPCLGACGGGSMVAIDYEDGTCALVSGLDETLAELGLADDENNDKAKRDPTLEDDMEQQQSPKNSMTLTDDDDDDIQPISENFVKIKMPAGKSDEEESTATNRQLIDATTTTMTMTTREILTNESVKLEETQNDKDGKTNLSLEAKAPTKDVINKNNNNDVVVFQTERLTGKSSSISSTSSSTRKKNRDVGVVGDARDRLRASAAENKQNNNNPWFDAAIYLAGKARDKILNTNNGNDE